MDKDRMNKSLVFFDTEFTDFQHADLISVALASEDGRELYIAITDYKRHLASTFVEEAVLPKIELPEAMPTLATKAEATQLIAEFIQQIPDICLVSDAEVDGMLLRHLLKKIRVYPQFALVQNLLEVDQALQMMNEIERVLSKHPGRHNALVDVRALKSAMEHLKLRE